MRFHYQTVSFENLLLYILEQSLKSQDSERRETSITTTNKRRDKTTKTPPEVPDPWKRPLSP